MGSFFASHRILYFYNTIELYSCPRQVQTPISQHVIPYLFFVILYVNLFLVLSSISIRRPLPNYSPAIPVPCSSSSTPFPCSGSALTSRRLGEDSRGKFSQLVAHHVLRNRHVMVDLAVVHLKLQPDEIRQNGRAARLCLDGRRTLPCWRANYIQTVGLNFVR